MHWLEKHCYERCLYNRLCQLPRGYNGKWDAKGQRVLIALTCCIADRTRRMLLWRLEIEMTSNKQHHSVEQYPLAALQFSRPNCFYRRRRSQGHIHSAQPLVH